MFRFVPVHPGRFLVTEKRFSLGRYPDVSLAEARRRRDDARKPLDAGIDPSAERQKQKLIATLSAGNTFGDIAKEYIERKLEAEGKAAITVSKAHWLVEQLSPFARDRSGHSLIKGNFTTGHAFTFAPL